MPNDYTTRMLYRDVLQAFQRANDPLGKQQLVPEIGDRAALRSLDPLSGDPNLKRLKEDIGWALTALTKYGALSRIRTGVYSITPLGHEILARSSEQLSMEDSSAIQKHMRKEDALALAQRSAAVLPAMSRVGTSLPAEVCGWLHCLGLQQAGSGARSAINLILEGVPGTGKTHSLLRLRESTGEPYGQGRYAMTMHPATSYEDFVEGLRPGPVPSPVWQPRNETGSNEIRVGITAETAQPVDPKGWLHLDQSKEQTFTVHDGFFVRMCREAVHFPDRTFVVLLDEINRCNIPKVMGDLLTTLEPSKRAKWVTPKDGAPGFWDTSKAQMVTLPYSQRSFFVSDNIIVVGTMNTTDRSVAPMDAALRRRFAFARVYPLGFTAAGFDDGDEAVNNAVAELEDAVPASWALWRELNRYLQSKFGDDAMLGHSYLHALKDALTYDNKQLLAESSDQGNSIVRSHWNLYIFPQLIDVLVSNDLVERVIKTDKGDDKPVKREECFTPVILDAAEKLGELKIELRGVGLLRTPSIRIVANS
jgi:hypothetical protein